MAEKKRAANIELLRIIAMMMVVVLHFMRESGSLPTTEAAMSGIPLTTVNLLATFFESFCIVAVNVYILISGYFGVKARWRPSKVIGFVGQIWFYAIGLVLVFDILGLSKALGFAPAMEVSGIYKWIKYLLPVSTGHYWFATAYFYLLLLMPLLNMAVSAMNKKQFTTVLAFLLIVFCGIKSLCPVELTMDSYGYDVVWFVCVYLTGAWLRLYGKEVPGEKIRKYALPVYVVSCFLIGSLMLLLYVILEKVSAASYYYTILLHYNFVLCLTGAVGLFLFFEKLTLKEGSLTQIIRKAGKYCFGVYLLHEHLNLSKNWYPFLQKAVNPNQNEGVIYLLTELLFCVAVIFAVGMIIEICRSAASGLISRRLLGKKADALDALFEKKEG